jgi:hypothetical protein
MNPASAAATNRGSRGPKKPQHRPGTAMRLLIQNLDTITTLLAGIWATHVAWCRAGIATPGLEALGRPERCIGPLLILFAVLEFAIAP